MKMMKKYSFIPTVVVLVFCSMTSFSLLSQDYCLAVITIYNKLPSNISVTIEGSSKQLAPWGSCTEPAEDDTVQIVPCYQTWEIRWDQALSSFLNFCSSSTEDEEDESAFEDDHEDWDEEEQEACKDYAVAITFKDVEGLDRSLDLSDQDRQILVINSEGLWKVKSPYLDHPEHFRDVYKWLENADLHQP
jgi:hypothetical protein